MINCGICGNAFESPDKRQYICEPCLVPPEYRNVTSFPVMNYRASLEPVEVTQQMKVAERPWLCKDCNFERHGCGDLDCGCAVEECRAWRNSALTARR